MDEQERRCSDHRQSTFSQTTTIANFDNGDDVVFDGVRRQSDQEKKYEYRYAESVSSDNAVHPFDTSKPEHIESTRGQERITIVEATPPRNNVESPTLPSPSEQEPPSVFKNSAVVEWIKRQCTSTDNRYAFQMSVAFTVAAVLVMLPPVSNVFPNAFWIGVSVVTVLDTTVGGFLSLSLQRFFGTIIGGAASIVVMTITRAMFHPKWEWPAAVVLGTFMFIQIFFIAKLKMRPNMAYSGSIGLLTTCIILLSGYPDLIHDRLSLAAELGAWRTLDLIIGIIISLIVSLFVFPVKAHTVMRRNLGKCIEDAADLYEKSSAYYLDFSGNTTTAINESLALAANNGRPLPEQEEQPSISEFITRAFSTRPAEELDPHLRDEIRQHIENVNQFWTHDTITSISNEAFGILAKLQTESTRLRNVASESKAQVIFHFFGGGKDRIRRDLRRAKRYNEAIEGMKRTVWPLVSFRLLLPLISLSHQPNQHPEGAPDEASLRERIKPTRETLESFKDTLKVMQKLGRILKDHTKPLSEFPEDWLEIQRMVTAGTLLMQEELKMTVRASMNGENMDNLKLLSYYGFLVRCSMIWDGLKTVFEKLSPLNGRLSRASSLGVDIPLPNREEVHAPD